MIKCILEFTEDKEITENKRNTVFKNPEILRLEFTDANYSVQVFWVIYNLYHHNCKLFVFEVQRPLR